MLHGSQTTNSQNYPFTYVYNAAGSVTSMTYPSGRKVTYAYDTDNRTTMVSNAAVSPNFNYGTVPTPTGYATNGSITSLTLGNNVVETTTFNPRFQPTDINAALGTTTLLDLSYFYCTPPLHTACTNNNGNVQSQAITRGSQIWTQTYGYTDGVNRLNSAGETGPGTSWTESYNYDNVGNRSVATPVELSNEIPQAQSWYTANSVTNNRVIAWTYDNAGNIQSIPLIGRSSTYDAENRQKSVTVNGVASNYTYDSDGHRITKSVGGAAATTYVYDPNGQLAAEYGTATDPDGGTRFLDADALGTTRLKADASATILNCYDFLPFGQELLAGADGRQPIPAGSTGALPACFASPSDDFNLKFTGKERDAESGLDYFGARYMSSAQGRFTSPDPFGAGAARLQDPQSWNLYAYVRNNPLLYVDSDGHNWTICDADGKNCRNLSDQQYNDYLKSIQGTNITVGAGGTITYRNSDGSYTNIGTASYYNERAENAGAFLNFASTTLAFNYVSELLGPVIGAFRAGSGFVKLGLEGAAEAANTRALVAELSLLKPNVTNPKLKAIVDELFQETDKLPGGTAGAVRWEQRTGDLLSPAGHTQEAGELITQLNNFLKNNAGISANDQAVAKELIGDLQRALSGK